MTTSPSFVAYYRVSTDKQGRSGLGLDAQRATVATYAWGRGEIIGEFQEVESGKHDARPQLQAALALCRRKKATLLIAKLDRLSRNVAFIASLMESHAGFVACDMPQANELTLHIMAAMAQHERRAIGIRTSEAMQAAKARGATFGSPRIEVAREVSSQGARRIREQVLPLVVSMRDEGATLRKIADELNRRGIKGHHGGHWHAASVRQVLQRVEREVAKIEEAVESKERDALRGV